ncbi:hypothetical protein Tco_0934508, partial [Tanacetum coccineum]
CEDGVISFCFLPFTASLSRQPWMLCFIVRAQVREEYRNVLVAQVENRPPVTYSYLAGTLYQASPTFYRIAGFLGQACWPAVEQAKNFRWGLHMVDFLDRIQFLEFTDVGSSSDSARNFGSSVDRDDYDRGGGGLSERSDKEA